MNYCKMLKNFRGTGLRVEGASGDRTVRIPSARTDIMSLDGTSNNPDLIVIATKAQHVLEAAVSAHRVIQDAEPHCALLLIQNGIGTTRFAVPIPLTPNKF